MYTSFSPWDSGNVGLWSVLIPAATSQTVQGVCPRVLVDAAGHAAWMHPSLGYQTKIFLAELPKLERNIEKT